jgi:hypothetical protein
MASAVRKLTGVGGDIRKIARLLQKEAPPGHMLAYINQEEADLLKARGGSGKPHADTGVPSFEEEYVPDYSPTSQYTGGGYGDAENLGTIQYAAPQTESIFSQAQNRMANLGYDYSPTGVASAKAGQYSGQAYVPSIYENPDRIYGQQTDAEIAAAGERFKTPSELGFQPGGSYPSTIDPNVVAAAAAIPTPREQGFAPGGSTPTDVKNVEPGFFEGMTEDTKKRLGIASIQGVLGAYQTQQAAEQGRKAREELMRLAQPYQEQGKKLIAQAQSGELTPAAQQTLQAAQAQAAQGAQARGGVGAQQAQAQVEALRQQLLQNQYDYGLKVSGIGDNIATGAIRTGLEADRYVNQLTNSYFTNIARTAYGQAPQVAGSPTYVREA